MIEVRTTKAKDIVELAKRYYGEPVIFLLIYQPDNLVVYYTGKNDINIEACEKHGAEIVSWQSNGGSAVASPGDIGIYLGLPGKYSNWCTFIRRKLKFWLLGHGINAVEERNDLTVKGNKIMGYTETVGSSYSSGSIFIAMESSNDLVNEICLKPKTRETDGLFYYGITTDEVIKVVIDATKEYLNLVGLEKGGN